MARSRTSWRPGQTRNPGGRPKEIAEVRKLAQAHTPDAIKRLAQIVTSEDSSDAAAVSAAREILDRAVGRAEQFSTSDLTVRNERAEDHKPDLEALLAQLRAEEAAKAKDMAPAPPQEPTEPQENGKLH